MLLNKIYNDSDVMMMMMMMMMMMVMVMMIHFHSPGRSIKPGILPNFTIDAGHSETVKPDVLFVFTQNQPAALVRCLLMTVPIQKCN